MTSALESIDQRDLRNLTAAQLNEWVRYITDKGVKEARDWQRKADAGCHRAEALVRGKTRLSEREKRMLANATILARIGRAAVTLHEDPEIGEDAIVMLQRDIAYGVV